MRLPAAFTAGEQKSDSEKAGGRDKKKVFEIAGGRDEICSLQSAHRTMSHMLHSSLSSPSFLRLLLPHPLGPRTGLNSVSRTTWCTSHSSLGAAREGGQGQKGGLRGGALSCLQGPGRALAAPAVRHLSPRAGLA